MKKFFPLLLAVSLLSVLAGCRIVPTYPQNSEPSEQKPALNYSLTYSYCVQGDVYVPGDIRKALNSFGKNECITPADPVVETYTEIPEFENNAKGTDPFCILLPDLDISKYRICAWRDTKTGLTTSGWYRIIGEPVEGMMTDELVRYDVDPSGSITQYETVNLGKYDALDLDESRLENLSNIFSNAISMTIGTKVFCQYFYTTTSQTVFRVFTDTQDRVVITTTITMEQEGKTVKADLYAVVK